MPRTPTGEYWPTRFRFAYVKPRNGIAALHANYNGIRIRQDLGVAFTARNKTLAVSLAETKVHELLGIVKARHVERSASMLSDALLVFTESVVKHSGANVIPKYRAAFAYFLTDFDCPLSDLEQIQNHLIARFNDSAYAASTKRKMYLYIRKFFDWGISAGYFTRNPMRVIATPKVKAKPDNEHLPFEEIHAIIEWLREHPNRACRDVADAVELLSITGMRISEALRLRVSDIREDHVLIHGKGGVDRVFPLSPFPVVADLLRRRIEQIKNFKTLSGSEYIYPWRNRANVERHYILACQALGIDRTKRYGSQMMNLHSLRVAAGYYMETVMRLDDRTICDLLGHSLAVRERSYRKKLSPAELTKRIANKLPND